MNAETSSGLATLPSAHPVVETVARLEALLAAKGVRLFARIDHAEGRGKPSFPSAPRCCWCSATPRPVRC